MTETRQSIADARRQTRNAERIIENIIVFLAGWVLTTLIVWKVTNLPGWEGMKAAFIRWAILYFLFLAKYFWIITTSNYGVVIQNYLQWKTSSGEDLEITDPTRIPDGQRGADQRIIAICPWEKVVEKPIHLVKGVPIEDLGFEVLDRDNLPYLVDWQTYLTPIPGVWLPRFLLVPEEAAKKFFTAFFRAALIVMFRLYSGDFIIDHLDKFNQLFGAVCGGSRRIDETEKEQGRFTNSPTVNKITRKAKGEEAKQLGSLAESQAKAVEILVKAGVSPDRASIMVMNLAGAAGIDYQVVDVQGLHGVQGGLHLNTGRGMGKK